MNSLSDLSLVTQVVVFQNRRAFDRLVAKYQSPIRRFFLNMTHGNEATSDDLAQETFIKAYTHLAQFRATASFSTWLYRIAYNVFYDYQRTKTLPSAGEWGDAPGARLSLASPSAPNSETSYDIHRAFAVLSDNERLCITLQLIDGLPIQEIVSATGMPEGTVKSHLSRGKEKLATFLKNNGYEHQKSKQ